MTSSDSASKGRGAARTHFTLVAGLAFCGVAFWFELHRALGGNGLSWAYVFEWPLLGGFAIYMWWKVLHPESENQLSSKTTKHQAALAPEFDGMLQAWEAHQRELDASRDDGLASPPRTPLDPLS